MTNNGTNAPQAGAGEEAVVSEHTAAFLAGNRAAEVIEVVEQAEDSPEQE